MSTMGGSRCSVRHLPAPLSDVVTEEAPPSPWGADATSKTNLLQNQRLGLVEIPRGSQVRGSFDRVVLFDGAGFGPIITLLGLFAQSVYDRIPLCRHVAKFILQDVREHDVVLGS